MNKASSVRIGGRVIPVWALALAFVALSLIAYSPYLNTGFSGDDFMFINMLEGQFYAWPG